LPTKDKRNKEQRNNESLQIREKIYRKEAHERGLVKKHFFDSKLPLVRKQGGTPRCWTLIKSGLRQHWMFNERDM
jgi:hypothetical protein